MSKTIGLLETGLPPEEFDGTYGSYPQMFIDLLSAEDDTLQFKTYAILAGEYPASADECDAWLITGSKHGVYEDHAWIPPLTQHIQDAYQANIPLVGICFGHQLIAQALGGTVVKSEKGWSLGVATYQLDNAPAWFNSTETEFAIQAYHQDQVIEPPEGAQTVAGSDFCPHAALVYGDRAISFQGHPEFSADYTKALLESRRASLPPAQSQQAIDGIHTPIQRAQVAKWIVTFLQQQR